MKLQIAVSKEKDNAIVWQNKILNEKLLKLNCFSDKNCDGPSVIFA